MRTTVDLPDDLFRGLKTMAVQRGTSLKELLRTAVEHELARAGWNNAVEIRWPSAVFVMGVDVLRPGEAWWAYEDIMRDSRRRFVAEPSGLETAWKSLVEASVPKGRPWTDAYLMAFAKAQGLHVVTFRNPAKLLGFAWVKARAVSL